MKLKTIDKILLVLLVLGLGAFLVLLTGKHPERAWQAYLINFLFFSMIAQGGLLFSTIMHTAKARWSGAMSGLAESFSAFFPVSFVLYLILFIGSGSLFHWQHEDLHGKEVWMNLPFLFSRDAVALLVLYGLGFAYLYHALRFKLAKEKGTGAKLRTMLFDRWGKGSFDEEKFRFRMSALAIIYMIAFTLVLSLIGYDLVMGMDPHWYSTLFGAYTFIKSIYLGLGSLIILAAVLQMMPNSGFQIPKSNFHDMGKLFFGFCLVWGDFFYCQFVVIWYGNIPEETSYIIQRLSTPPWDSLTWAVFTVSFILPFILLLSKKTKTKPVVVMSICAGGMAGIWFEHLLLIGPIIAHDAVFLPFGLFDFGVFLGFLGLMGLAVSYFMKVFPELKLAGEGGAK